MFPENLNVSRDEVEGNIEIRYCYIAKLNKTKVNFEKRAEIPATTSDHLQLHDLITCNYLPFDVKVFAMLPAHGIWRETVSLLDVM